MRRLFARLVDSLAELAEGELSYRKQNPCAFADELRDRQARARKRGWVRMASRLSRRISRWDARCVKAGPDAT